jgi:hypothetical protein
MPSLPSPPTQTNAIIQSAYDLVSSSLRLIGVIDPGEGPDISEANDSMMVLNQMIDSWNADRAAIFTTGSQDFTLTLNKQAYTFGPGGDFDAQRPASIDSMSSILLDNPNNPVEIPIPMWTWEQWQEKFPVKNVDSSFPLGCYDDGNFPLRTLNFWPIPTSGNNAVRIYSWQAVGAASSLQSKLSYPQGYAEALRYNLAVRLAAEFAAPVSGPVAQIAIESLARVKTMNAPQLNNWFVESNESGAIVEQQAYGGREGTSLKSLIGTPGLKVFSTLPQSPVRGQFSALGRYFAVGGSQLWEIADDGSQTSRGTVANDGKAVSIAFNNIQLLIVSGGRAYCFTLATNVLLDVTDQLAGVPIQCDYSDTYFIVCFQNSNKYQMSQVLDGTTWPGTLVNEVSVFPDNITSIIVNHRELWVFGQKRSQPFQNTGSLEVFDPISGALIETGCAATFAVTRLDNSLFWIGQDERGALVVWRSNGYTPARVSTHAVEYWLALHASSIAGLVAYSYQTRGHLFWVLYVPNSDCNWVYDVTENMWHKRASWVNGAWGPHFSWNYCYAFGRHLVGDWNSGNIYDMSFDHLDDNGAPIRRLRRSPTMTNENQWIPGRDLTLNFATGLGPQPPFLDGNNAPRPPQVMIRWSNDQGKTWTPERILGCGMAGEYGTRVVVRRIGRWRNRVWEMVVTDPIPWTLTDEYLRLNDGQ